MPTWKCAAARELPINTERSWDGDAAKGRIFAWAGGEDAVGSKARRGFLAFDSDQAADRASYNLAFADVVDGALVAIADGVRAAASRLPGVEMSEECRSDARAVIDGYMEKVHDEGATDEERAAGGIMLSRIPLVQGDRARQPKTLDDLPESLLAHIHDTSVVTDERLPYLNKARASTDLVDTYSTRMMPSTLRNYADDATGGIAIQNSHRVDELSLGRTFEGTFKNGRSGAPSRTEMDFYIPPGLRTSDVSTDDVINGIKWGTIKDVSVGFYGGELRCSLCRKPMLEDIFYILFFGGDEERDQVDPEAPCAHLPGVEYPLRDKDGKKLDERAVAIGEIENAHCAELSLVFNGATPQAQIMGRSAPVLVKATRMLEAGVLTRSAALALEHRFRSVGVRFPDLTKRRFPTADWLAIRQPHVAPDATRTEDDGNQPPPSEEPPPAQQAGADGDPPIPPSAPAAASEHAPQEAASMPPQPTDGAPAEGAETRAAQTAAAPPEQTAGGGAANPSASPGSSAATADPLLRIRKSLVTLGLAPEGFDGDAEAICARFAELSTELSGLREWADIGHQARENLANACKKAGVRALGSNWSEAAYAPVLTRGTYQELNQLKEHLDKLGDERFPGGRASQDDVDPPANRNGNTRIPARAFRAG